MSAPFTRGLSFLLFAIALLAITLPAQAQAQEPVAGQLQQLVAEGRLAQPVADAIEQGPVEVIVSFEESGALQAAALERTSRGLQADDAAILNAKAVAHDQV